MRFESERPPDPRDRGLRHSRRARERTRRPVRRVAWGLLQRLDDYPLDVLVADRARRTRTRFVGQPLEATRDEPRSPLADSRLVHAHTRRDRLIRQTLRARQHDPAPQRQRLRARASTRPPLQRLALLAAQHQLGLRPPPTRHTRTIRRSPTNREYLLTRDLATRLDQAQMTVMTA